MHMMWLDAVSVVLLCVLVWVSFGNSWYNEFTFDDHLAIEGNGDVDVNNQPFEHLWLSDIWGKDLLAHDSHRSYRPFLIVAFRWLYTQSHRATIFRVASVAAHALTTALVYAVGRLVVFKSNFDSRYGSWCLALAASALFATHPIHVEAVTAVVNLAEPCSASAFLLSYLCFHFSRKAWIDVNVKGSLSRVLRVLFWTTLWWLLAIVATLFKETGILAAVLPLAYVIGRMIVRMAFDWLSGGKMEASSSKGSTVIPFGFAVFSVVNFLAFLHLYFALRSILVHPARASFLADPVLFVRQLLVFWQNASGDSYLNASQLLRRAENPFAFLTGSTKVYSMLYLYFRYVYVLCLPYEQSPEYSYNCIAQVDDVHDVRNLYSGVMILVFFVLGVWSLCALYPRSSAKVAVAVSANKDDTDNVDSNSADNDSDDCSQGTLFECLLWLYIPFLPLTGIVFTLGTLLAERLLYVPSIGFCWLAVYLCARLLRGICTAGQRLSRMSSASAGGSSNASVRKCSGWWLWVARSVLVTLVAVASAWYIQVVQPSHMVMYTTNSGRVFHSAFENGPFCRTRTYNLIWSRDATLFLHAVSVCPNSAKSHLQVSKLYSNAGALPEARRHLQEAQRIDPDFCDVHVQDAYIWLGHLMESGGDPVSTLNNPVPPGGHTGLSADGRGPAASGNSSVAVWSLEYVQNVVVTMFQLPDIYDTNPSSSSSSRADTKQSAGLSIPLKPMLETSQKKDPKRILRKALQAIVRSSGCVYTSRQAIQLLQQLWQAQQQLLQQEQHLRWQQQVQSFAQQQQQVKQHQQQQQLLQELQQQQQHHTYTSTLALAQLTRQQAQQAHRFGLSFVAAQKWTEAARMLFDLQPPAVTTTQPVQGQVLDAAYYQRLALFVLAKARSTIDHVLATTSSAERTNEDQHETDVHSSMELTHQFACQIYALQGSFRSAYLEKHRTHYHTYQSNDTKGKQTTKAIKRQRQAQWQAGRRRILQDLAHAALSPACLRLSLPYAPPPAPLSTSSGVPSEPPEPSTGEPPRPDAQLIRAFEHLSIASLHAFKWMLEEVNDPMYQSSGKSISNLTNYYATTSDGLAIYARTLLVGIALHAKQLIHTTTSTATSTSSTSEIDTLALLTQFQPAPHDDTNTRTETSATSTVYLHQTLQHQLAQASTVYSRLQLHAMQQQQQLQQQHKQLLQQEQTPTQASTPSSLSEPSASLLFAQQMATEESGRYAALSLLCHLLAHTSAHRTPLHTLHHNHPQLKPPLQSQQPLMSWQLLQALLLLDSATPAPPPTSIHTPPPSPARSSNALARAHVHLWTSIYPLFHRHHDVHEYSSLFEDIARRLQRTSSRLPPLSTSTSTSTSKKPKQKKRKGDKEVQSEDGVFTMGFCTTIYWYGDALAGLSPLSVSASTLQPPPEHLQQQGQVAASLANTLVHWLSLYRTCSDLHPIATTATSPQTASLPGNAHGGRGRAQQGLDGGASDGSAATVLSAETVDGLLEKFRTMVCMFDPSSCRS